VDMSCRNCSRLDRREITEEEWGQEEIYGILLIQNVPDRNKTLPSCRECFEAVYDKKAKLIVKRRL